MKKSPPKPLRPIAASITRVALSENDQVTMDARQGLLADDWSADVASGIVRPEKPKAAARVLMANRQQMELRPSDLESLLPEGHRARLVWGYVVNPFRLHQRSLLPVTGP